MHWPVGFDPKMTDVNQVAMVDSVSYVETYKEMEKLIATGKVKAIGVSNLYVTHCLSESCIIA